MLPYEGYQPYPLGLGNDVALLHLAEPTTVAPIPHRLGPETKDELMAPGTVAQTIGFGQIDPITQEIPDTLQEVDAEVREQQACHDAFVPVFGGELAEVGVGTSVCVDGIGVERGVCYGDSGSALMVPTPDGSWALGGVTSFGLGDCAVPEAPEYFADVSQFNAWIDACIEGSTECTVYEPPPDFRCSSGETIPGIWECDAWIDCPDGSDEINCDTPNQTCDDGQVVPAAGWCDGFPQCTDGSDETACGTQVLVELEDEPAGENCANGGVKVTTGTDQDESGELDESEVTDTAFVCDGADGMDGMDGEGKPGVDGRDSMVELTDEDPGDNCRRGGMRVDAGLDVNGNGLLDPDEVSETEYVCNGRDGRDGQDGTLDLNCAVTKPTPWGGIVLWGLFLPLLRRRRT